VAARQPPLDPLLPLQQPVKRPVQLVGVNALDRELLRQRRLRERPRAGQLRARRQHLLADHRQHPRALRRQRAVEQPHQPEPTRHPEHGSDLAVRQRARDLELLDPDQEALAGEPPAHQLDQLLGQVREVADRLVADLAALAVGTAQQVRDVFPAARPTPTIGDDMNRPSPARHTPIIAATSDRPSHS